MESLLRRDHDNKVVTRYGKTTLRNKPHIAKINDTWQVVQPSMPKIHSVARVLWYAAYDFCWYLNNGE